MVWAGGGRGLPGLPAGGEWSGGHSGRHILISALFSSPIYKPFWGAWLFCTPRAFTEFRHSKVSSRQAGTSRCTEADSRTTCGERCCLCISHGWTHAGCWLLIQIRRTRTLVPCFLVEKVISRNWWLSLFRSHSATIPLHIVCLLHLFWVKKALNGGGEKMLLSEIWCSFEEQWEKVIAWTVIPRGRSVFCCYEYRLWGIGQQSRRCV